MNILIQNCWPNFRLTLVESLAICGARRCESAKSGCVYGCVNAKMLDKMKDASWAAIESADSYSQRANGGPFCFENQEVYPNVSSANVISDFKQKVIFQWHVVH